MLMPWEFPDDIGVDIPYDAALSMVRQFHYLGTLPKSVRTNFGAYAGGILQACACFGHCHAPRLPNGVLELRRLVKRPGSEIKLSQFLARCIRVLRKRGVPALLTWADPEAGHHGGIYQATNWVYNEPRSYNWNSHFRRPDGTVVDHRKAYEMFGTSSKKKVLELNPDWTAFLPAMKLRYAMPLNMSKVDLLNVLNARELPYPKPLHDAPKPKRIPTVRRVVPPWGH